MTLTNSVVAKFAIAFVAIAMTFSAFAPVQAQTAEELQATIDALMAQIAELNATVGTVDTMISSCVSVPAPLTIGAQNADVTALQNFLIGAGQTIPAGATGYFGGQTQAALAGWQAANGVAPAVGYYGPITKAAMDAACVITEVEEEEEGEEEEEEEEEEENNELSGEASLNKFEMSSADDDELEEGQSDAVVAESTVEFEDGDAMITRLDVELVGSGTETDPWDTFETVSLWIDGDMIAEKNADDEDDYLDEDDGSLRFSGLDIFAAEDEEVDIDVAVSVQNSVDGTNDGEAWTVTIESMRFVDAEDVTTTVTDGDTDADEMGDLENFTIEEAGADDEVIVKSNNDDPESDTFQLEDDSKSDWYSVFMFDLDTDDSVNDIEFNEVTVSVELSSSTYALVVDDAELVIDGTTIDDVTASTSGMQADLAFDIDGEVTVDAGDRVAAELRLRFKSLPTGNEGMTVQGRVTAVDADAIDAEGADDLAASQLSGSATGDVHTLRTMGISAVAGEIDEDVTTGDNSDDDYATYEIEVDVTAFEQDVFIAIAPGTSINYTLEDGAGSTTPTGARTVTLTSTGDEEGSSFKIDEGSTETITVAVTYVPGSGVSVAARMQLDSIVFGASDGATDQTWTASPDEDFRTSVVTMVD